MSAPADKSEVAREIARENGMEPAQLREIHGQGAVNHVFVASDTRQTWIVRFERDPWSSGVFEKEAWCLEQAAVCRVPSPRVIAVGTCNETPYLIQSFVEGSHGPRIRSLDLWRKLGSYAAKVNSIPVPADAPANLFQRFSRDLPIAWRMHLDYNVRELNSDDPLIGLGVYARESQSRIREVFERLGERAFRFGLNHGDLALRNLIVPQDGTAVLIDWGSAEAGVVPYGDFVNVYEQHLQESDPDLIELDAFLEGYELEAAEVIPVARDILLLNRIDLVRWAKDRRPTKVGEMVEKARAFVRELD